MNSNGCHNRKPYATSYLAQDGHHQLQEGVTGNPRAPRYVEVPHAMTTDCQYTHTDLGRKDAGCHGCKWRA